MSQILVVDDDPAIQNALKKIRQNAGYEVFVAEENFVVMNCAAIPDNLIESELFGHEKGALQAPGFYTSNLHKKIKKYGIEIVK